MFPFDVILFDVGGVLLTNGWDHRERARVLEAFQLDRAAFEARHTEPYDAWERDKITARQYLDATLFYEPRNFSADEFLTAIFEQSELLPDSGFGILQELAASGNCMLGCLNNEAREPNEFRFAKFGLRDYFEVALSSCYVGMRKPQPDIYRRAIDILGKPSNRILFIDDRRENAEAAEAAGMQTIRFEGAATLRRGLETRGVL